MAMTREPLLNINIDEEIKNNLHELFEAEVLEDRFEITEAGDNIITGNYGNSFNIIDPDSGDNVHYELDFGQETKMRKVGGQTRRSNPFNAYSRIHGHDFNEGTGQLAVSTSSCFFIFSKDQLSDEL